MVAMSKQLFLGVFLLVLLGASQARPAELLSTGPIPGSSSSAECYSCYSYPCPCCSVRNTLHLAFGAVGVVRYLPGQRLVKPAWDTGKIDIRTESPFWGGGLAMMARKKRAFWSVEAAFVTSAVNHEFNHVESGQSLSVDTAWAFHSASTLAYHFAAEDFHGPFLGAALDMMVGDYTGTNLAESLLSRFDAGPSIGYAIFGQLLSFTGRIDVLVGSDSLVSDWGFGGVMMSLALGPTAAYKCRRFAGLWLDPLD